MSHELNKIAALLEELLDANVEDVRARVKARRELYARIEDLEDALHERFDALIDALKPALPAPAAPSTALTTTDQKKAIVTAVLPVAVKILQWVPAGAAVVYEALRAYFHSH